MSRTNLDLIEKYNHIYENDSTKFFTCNVFEESKMIMDSLNNWKDLEVLEIGCGEGALASMISYAGAKYVDAIDYSEVAINHAKKKYNIPNVNYTCCNFTEITKKYDIVVLQGVLEHFDTPFISLKKILDNNLKQTGILITSSPSFLNPRGYIWMTLQSLFDIPMSLTDLHYLCPFDFKNFCETYDYKLTYISGYQDWGSGQTTINDFNKRLRNAIKDANMDNSKVDKLLNWLTKSLPYFQQTNDTGAMIAYKIYK
jgi:2-polyprenyl-3-methyl-5-hydroxy-6-metoxy-1,4-benzoquinol methylase